MRHRVNELVVVWLDEVLLIVGFVILPLQVFLRWDVVVGNDYGLEEDNPVPVDDGSLSCRPEYLQETENCFDAIETNNLFLQVE